MTEFLKKASQYLLPVVTGFAAGLAAAALVTRTGLIELGDPDEGGETSSGQ